MDLQLPLKKSRLHLPARPSDRIGIQTQQQAGGGAEHQGRTINGVFANVIVM